MPIVLRAGPYRFFFYSSDEKEPVHIHVEREDKVAKFWVEPVRLSRSGRFGASELLEIQRIVTKNKGVIIRKWNEHFSD